VVIDEIQEKNIKTIFATLFLERPSQRIIVLGPGGERLKKIGTKARREIELVTGKQVFLNLHISIEKEWQRNPRSLEKFGF
jgi:GTP-binding protein Era